MTDPTPPIRYELRITATGTVRDADGNVLNEAPIEATAVLTEDELATYLEGLDLP